MISRDIPYGLEFTPEHLAILKRGAAEWNQWRKENRHVIPNLGVANLRGEDLSYADLSYVNLGYANLSQANLTLADLGYANLTWADLSQANLKQANLTLADLIGADLSDADLNGASLSYADLNGADLSRADLSRTDLRGTSFNSAILTLTDFDAAQIGYTVFANNNLSATRKLKSVVIHDKSTIGIDTIYKSHGLIPRTFLRGCGVPESFIAIIPQLFQPDSEFINITLADRNLSPGVISSEISPFVSATAELQSIINQMKGVPSEEVVVRLISHSSPININFDGAKEAVREIKEDIIPWRRKHAKKIARLQEQEKQVEIESKKAEILEKQAKGQAETDKVAAEASIQCATAERMKIENDRLRLELHREQIQLALDMIEKFAPGMSEQERITYVIKLLPPINTLVFSELLPGDENDSLE